MSKLILSGISRFVDVTGDTMTGALTINTNSTTALLVEQDGVKDNVLVVDTTTGAVRAGLLLHVGGAAFNANRILNIDTTYTPVASPTVFLYINHINTTTFDTYGINAVVDSTLAAGTRANQIGIRAFVRNSGAGTVTNMYGFTGTASPNAGVVGSAYGLDFQTQNGGATATSVYGIRARVTHTAAASNSVNAYGIALSSWSKHASATVTNSYGIYADTTIDVGSTLKYFIYSLSTSPSLFTGKIQINSDTLGLELGAGQDASLVYDGTNLVINPKVVGTGVLSVLGDISLLDEDIILGTTTGTKIGTAITQKIAFYNSTPIVQPTGAVLTALSNLGLVASPTLSHTALSDIGTNTHAQIDTHIAATGTAVHGLGTISTQASNSVSITGGSITGITDLAIADGGTGASDAATARTNIGIQDIFGGTGDDETVPASSSYYGGFFKTGLSSLQNVGFPIPINCTIIALYVRTGSTQSVTGTLVITLRNGATLTDITLTVPAGNAVDTFSDIAHTAVIAAGDRIDIKLVNNATAASASIRGFAILYTY